MSNVFLDVSAMADSYQKPSSGAMMVLTTIFQAEDRDGRATSREHL
jgi:hypothetical protein